MSLISSAEGEIPDALLLSRHLQVLRLADIYILGAHPLSTVSSVLRSIGSVKSVHLRGFWANPLEGTVDDLLRTIRTLPVGLSVGGLTVRGCSSIILPFLKCIRGSPPQTLHTVHCATFGDNEPPEVFALMRSFIRAVGSGLRDLSVETQSLQGTCCIVQHCSLHTVHDHSQHDLSIFPPACASSLYTSGSWVPTPQFRASTPPSMHLLALQESHSN